jgi:magnesium transporter
VSQAPTAITEPTVPETEQQSFTLDDSYVSTVATLCEDKKQGDALLLIKDVAAPDLAELFDRLDTDARQWLADLISENSGFHPDVLAEMSAEATFDVVEALGAERTAEAIADLESDDAIHVIEDLELHERHEIMEGLPTELRQEIEQGLTYPEDSAGRLMRQHLVAVPESWNVGQTIDFLRAEQDLPIRFTSFTP